MLQELFTYAWVIVQLAIGYNLVLPLLLYLIYLTTSSTVSAAKRSESSDYAIIVTVYEYTGTLNDTIHSILNLNYKNFLVYIVADNCDMSGLGYEDPRVIILKPDSILASNTKSHLFAVNNFRRNHERITIIDSDNLVHPEYLNELDKWFKKGFEAVQGYRQAKNLDTTLACLDAARDIYYHFYDGKLLFALGSSATLSGSGMAFTTNVYKSFLGKYNVIGAGFDKVLQYALVKSGIRIAFSPNAVVYDEKTAKSEQLINQRSRWIRTWFKYFSFGFDLVFQGIRLFDRNKFLFGLILLRPPLFIFLILSLIFLIINALMGSTLAIVWAAAMVCFLIGFLLALFNSHVDRKIYQSLVGIPKFILYQILSLFNIKKTHNSPITTRHNGTLPTNHSFED